MMRALSLAMLVTLLLAAAPACAQLPGLEPGIIDEGPGARCDDPTERCTVWALRNCLTVVWFDQSVGDYHVWGTGCGIIIDRAE